MVTEEEAEKAVVERLADIIYDTYCKSTGRTPWHKGYRPVWALEYADAAVDFLGIPEDMVQELVA